ncbi:MAG: hypothetical protein V4650_00685 [Pseudomonadota bacterium]
MKVAHYGWMLLLAVSLAPAAAPASAPAAATAKPGQKIVTTTVVQLPPPVAGLHIDRQHERELSLVVDMELAQTWKKNDPQYPGEQWSKATGRQHYEIVTRLRSDGKLEVRNLLDPDKATRLKAKTIHLARQAKKQLEANGEPFQLPTTPAGLRALDARRSREYHACKGEAACVRTTQLRYAAIYAALQYPEALLPDTEPGVFHYYLPYPGCPGRSRVSMSLSTEGVRYNKDSDKFVPFSERRSADTVDFSDGLQLCDHFAAVIDIEDAAKPMYQETIYIPSMFGPTEYTENGHTSREEQSQIFPTEVLDWIGIYLSQAPVFGALETTLPITLPLNGNATSLGRWTGTAKLKMRWSFRDVSAAPATSTKNQSRPGG